MIDFMNEFISGLVLAVLQGIAEWIPVSSSGHLILFEKILGFEGGLLFIVALHFGTLMSVFVYFGKDITDIMQDFFRGKWKTENGRLGVYIIIATIPAVVVGFFIKDFIEAISGNLFLLAFGFGITGLLLIISSLDLNNGKGELTARNSFLIGCAQVISLFRGISRSGSTISSGVLLGLDIKKAVRFSFLMSIPVIFGANILELGSNKLTPDYIWPTLLSFVIGLIAIHILYKYMLTSKRNLRWFGLYALVLALSIGVYLLFF